MQNIESIIVADHMTSFPHVVSPEHSMAAAHRLMRRHNIRHLPVVSEGKLVGLVSQRDLYFFESLTQLETEKVCVKEAMEENVQTVSSITPLSKVIRMLAEFRIGSVVVTDDGNKAIGIFTCMDALDVLYPILETGQIAPES